MKGCLAFSWCSSFLRAVVFPGQKLLAQVCSNGSKRAEVQTVLCDRTVSGVYIVQVSCSGNGAFVIRSSLVV